MRVGYHDASTSGEEHEDDEAHYHLPDFSNDRFTIADGRFSFRDSLDSLIGIGGFGVVFRGRDEDTGKQVAIKRVLKQQIKTSEISVIQALQSSYLVGLIDICQFDDVYACLIMELCDNDLDHHIRCTAKERKLNNHNLRLLIDNLARGYKALYELRIVHRDIKPQNILVKYAPCSTQFMATKITDFGIARTLENGEDMCNVAGTLFYMAPEVGANLLKTCQYNAEVDMWSIGCLIYQCIAGDVPFDECSLCKLFLHTAGANYDAYDQPDLPAGTDEQVVHLVHSLLEIDSTKRATPEDFFICGTKIAENKVISTQ